MLYKLNIYKILYFCQNGRCLDCVNYKIELFEYFRHIGENFLFNQLVLNVYPCEILTQIKCGEKVYFKFCFQSSHAFMNLIYEYWNCKQLALLLLRNFAIVLLCTQLLPGYPQSCVFSIISGVYCLYNVYTCFVFSAECT